MLHEIHFMKAQRIIVKKYNIRVTSGINFTQSGSCVGWTETVMYTFNDFSVSTHKSTFQLCSYRKHKDHLTCPP